MVLILAQLAYGKQELDHSQGCCVAVMHNVQGRQAHSYQDWIDSMPRSQLNWHVKQWMSRLLCRDKRVLVTLEERENAIGTGQDTLLHLERRGICADSQKRAKGGAES